MIAARDEEGGQALAIAAAGAFVLVLALALTIDWGYAVVQRRIAQNDADKVALEVGRLLTSSVGLSGNTPIFAVAGTTWRGFRQRPLTQVEACAAAVAAYQRDRATPVARPAIWLRFEQWSDGSSNPDGFGQADCAPGRPRTVSVDSGTTTVRVRVEFRYKPIFASLLRQPEVVVGATSRVALSGAPYTVDPQDNASLNAQTSVSQGDYANLARSASSIIRTWPLVRRYDRSFIRELRNGRPCGPQCDPTTATPLDFTSSQILNLSGQSARGNVDQLITKAQPGTSLSDWFADGFGGVIGLDTKWRSLRTPSQNAAPTLDPDRCSVPQWLPTPPSCRPDPGQDESTRGDWIETMRSSISASVGDMRALIQTKGTTTAYSTKVIPGGGGRTYGRALVVWIYLWDCGQRFEGDGQTGQWAQIRVSRDCSSRASTDRLHIFSVIPITFYEGLVTNSSISGYWGGDFVAAGRCQAARSSCPALTPLANTAFLVADDQRWNPADDGGGGGGDGDGGGGDGDGGGGGGGGDGGGD